MWFLHKISMPLPLENLLVRTSPPHSPAHHPSQTPMYTVAWKANFLIGFVRVRLVVFQITGSLKVSTVHEPSLVAPVATFVTFVMTSWFAFAGCNKPKIDQGGQDKQCAHRTGLLVSLLFGEVCKCTTSMDLLKSYEIDECSSQELVEPLS